MTVNAGDTAWVIGAAALVMFMTPGLALFYGGMVRTKNVLAMLMQNFFALGLVSVLWGLIGYSLAFGGTGEYTRMAQRPRNQTHAENRMRSAMAPVMRAGVMTANIIW